MPQAYNDWHIDEWAASYPGRFIPLAIPRCGTRRRSPTEVRRVAAKGCHAITMPELPHVQGLPELPRRRVLGPVLPRRVRGAGS